jgi:hypothetical protein
VDLTVWLDHHGWQSGKGRLDGRRLMRATPR